ncbi:outer membrane beta-barrel protein [Arenimonas oryziterrae]|nr:outer membrane beta-barrel protein [Arenimonas oryziterrae]
MNRNTLALPLATGLGLCLMAPAAFASSPTFYGSIEYGHNDASDAEYVHEFSVDATGTQFAPLPGTDFDSGNSGALRLGLRFDAHLFVELAFNNADADGGPNALAGAASTPCIAANNFNDDICSLNSRFSSDYESRNIDLIVGWTMQPGTRSTFSPYLGMRRMKFQDTRQGVDAISSGGNFGQVITTDFSHTGWVAGLRFKQNFATNWFFNAEVQQARANGDRNRVLSGTFTAPSPGNRSLGVTQRMMRVAVGRNFKMGNGTGSLSLGYQDLSHGGIDTTQFTSTSGGTTIGQTYVPNYAAIGDANADISMRGFFLSFGINH